MTCKTHPDAPHGFVRNASHNEDRYVCECEFWEPPEVEKQEPVAYSKQQMQIYAEANYEAGYTTGYMDGAIKTCETYLESQEPVAWGVDWSKAGDIPCASIIKRLPNGGIEVMAVEYAPHPPQRTWVGLDHHDTKKFSSWLDHKSDDEVFTAIEAKLKELNT